MLISRNFLATFDFSEVSETVTVKLLPEKTTFKGSIFHKQSCFVQCGIFLYFFINHEKKSSLIDQVVLKDFRLVFIIMKTGIGILFKYTLITNKISQSFTVTKCYQVELVTANYILYKQTNILVSRQLLERVTTILVYALF